jgi:hypothetical protein
VSETAGGPPIVPDPVAAPAPAGGITATTASSRVATPADPTDVTIATALVAIAVALRLWHIGWGLPGFTDDALPLRLGLAMRSLAGGRLDPNPHAFHIPSLAVYLHLAVQQCVYLVGRLRGAWSNPADYRLAAEIAPDPIVLAARALSIACDGVTVLAAWRIGRRVSRLAGFAVALVVTGSATFITAARGIHAETLATAFALLAIERMLAWHDRPTRGRLIAAALWTGLATGAVYPAMILILPLVTLVLARKGRRGLAGAILAVAIATLAFLATTPFALLDRATFGRDVIDFWRGSFPGIVPFATLGDRLAALARDLGWPVLAALALSPAAARVRDRRAIVLVLGSALLGFGVCATQATGAGLTPVLALAAILAAITLSVVVDRVPVELRLPAALAALAVFTAMPVANGLGVARRGGRDTRVIARRWCETHIAADQFVLAEAHGPDLMDDERFAGLRDGPVYPAASPAWQARVDRLHPLHAVTLPLAVTGALTNDLRLTGLPPVTVLVAPRVSTIDRIYYEPALFVDADYVITTGAVRDRYAADPEAYATQCRMYHALDRTAEVAARFPPAGDASGSEITVYRIDARAHAALGRQGTLDPLWWTAAIPDNYRRVATRLLDEERRVRDSLLSTPAAPPTRGVSGSLVAAPRPRVAVETAPEPAPVESGPGIDPSVRDADGNPEPWVTSLRPLYQTHVAGFAELMSRTLAALGRNDGAARLAEANLAMMPEDVTSCVVAGVTLARMGRWTEARATIERTLAVLDPQRVDPLLELEYARVLAHTGDPGRAKEIDERLVSRPAGDPIATAAATDLKRLP